MKDKRQIISITPVFIRIQDTAKKLGLDFRNITREYGINKKTAQMLEDMLARKS